MLGRKFTCFFAGLFAIFMTPQLTVPVLSEDTSLLNGATVLDVGLYATSSNKENLMSNSFAAYVVTDGNIGLYNDYSKWFTIDLDTSKTCVTVFLSTRPGSG